MINGTNTFFIVYCIICRLVPDIRLSLQTVKFQNWSAASEPKLFKTLTFFADPEFLPLYVHVILCEISENT